ncbi:PepSY-associated TM helix domain-containing protein [Agitococcus lubricus]|uniref:PepSY-associated transmembrane protein n=1 Tax=Agitococcus lubricus TaxID=1077255 RepID=A0A2T5IWN0_9GAMM|nr:PepSY-associated TM helix domain-containing protein [Agitococcus lubricus]PTQ88307.1 PepSY-associated transmembrane protein [Agitococcus lubricus]
MAKKLHWRFWLLRWHRRIGIVLGFFLLWMLATGALINHSDDLGLAKKNLQSSLWHEWYGLTPPKTLKIGQQSVSFREKSVWLGQDNIGACAEFIGWLTHKDYGVLACTDHVWLMLTNGDIVDQLDRSRGLNIDISAIGQYQEHLFIRDTQQQTWQLNVDDLSLSPSINSHQLIAWQAQFILNSSLSQEQLLLDLHSGRLGGKWGVWLVDILSIGVCVLVLSGWFLSRKRHRHGL